MTLQESTGRFSTGCGQLARRYVSIVMQPQLLRLRRIIIGEADRFPGVARTWYQQGPERVAATLGARFQKLAQRGLLRMDDPVEAANQFNWLVLSIPLNKLMFYGDEAAFSKEELDHYADSGVRVFLAAYGMDRR